MSVAEIKVEVINKITNLNNESVLKEVLKLVEDANGKEQSSFNLTGAYETIKVQYGDVLHKLAQ